MTCFWKFERRRTIPDKLTQSRHHRWPEYGVFHAHDHEALPGPRCRPEVSRATRDGSAIGLCAIRHQVRKPSHAGLVSRIRKRRGVGGGFDILQIGHRPFHECSDVHIRIAVGEGSPSEKALAQRHVTGTQHGIHHQQSLEPIRRIHWNCKSDQSPPILTHQHDAAEVEGLEQGNDGGSMEIEGVDVLVHRLVGTTKAEEIRSDDAVPRSEKRWDHLSVEVSPGRLTMQAKRYRRGLRSFVEIVHSQRTDISVMRLEGVVWQSGKSLVLGSKRLHVAPSLNVRAARDIAPWVTMRNRA